MKFNNNKDRVAWRKLSRDRIVDACKGAKDKRFLSYKLVVYMMKVCSDTVTPYWHRI